MTTGRINQLAHSRRGFDRREPPLSRSPSPGLTHTPGGTERGSLHTLGAFQQSALRSIGFRRLPQRPGRAPLFAACDVPRVRVPRPLVPSTDYRLALFNESPRERAGTPTAPHSYPPVGSGGFRGTSKPATPSTLDPPCTHCGQRLL